MYVKDLGGSQLMYDAFTFVDTSTLNNAIGFTAKTYHEIAELHAEQVGCG